MSFKNQVLKQCGILFLEEHTSKIEIREGKDKIDKEPYLSSKQQPAKPCPLESNQNIRARVMPRLLDCNHVGFILFMAQLCLVLFHGGQIFLPLKPLIVDKH